MNARRLGPWVALLLTAPFGFIACNTLLGIEEPQRLPSDAATSDTGVPPGETGGGCAVARWPEAPTSEDPSGAGDVSFVTALKSIGLSLDPPAPVTGYDLDGVCTCPGPEACMRSDASTPPQCDDENGRDVSLNRNVSSFLMKTPGFSPEDLNAGLALGKYGILTEVRGYNGGLNDKQVEVSLFLSSGTGAGDAGAPDWDGGDKWDLDPVSLAGTADGGPPTSQYVDKTAYVRDGVLVASRLNGLKLTLGVGTASVTLETTQAAVTAKVVKRGGGWALESGTIVGRLPTSAMLKAIGPLPVPGGTSPLCSPASSFFYGIVKTAVCRAADLSSNPARDLDRGAACDALSFAMRFEAEPALFGGRRAGPRLDGGCAPTWADECTK